ncbi:alpha/beta fold hydrolase [Pseudonocardia endophytica]|uniref:Alpha/beta hydrolase family protein n=1 Tax=Pseudonocardia endophytica TaxID=401976 RepID=A0A4R1HMM2_PSEEN|nr:alpha/beta fold hydrolase [Pseudonocardia endophytica]TCK21580.1 alpha/beta hydrolase family protein [Pseudonocardia endophytica]
MRAQPPIARFTLDGVSDAAVSAHPFTADDGLELSLMRFTRETSGDAVLLIPGLTTSTDMFVMPEHRNLVTHLLDEGFDVWCLDGRMSMRHPYNSRPHRTTFDEGAHYDHPAAVAYVRRETGGRPLHVVAHCMGALTFSMSMTAGLLPGPIASVVLNSVALTPRVPWWSSVKLALGPALFGAVGIDVLDPSWSERTTSWKGRVVARAVSAAHRECDVSACHLLSMMWGTGWPALYEHANLDDRTHARAADLFGPSGLHYYRHMHQMVRAGRAVRFRPHRSEHAALPDDYLAAASQLETDILLVTGSHNRVFTDSNVVCHDRLCDMGVRGHELRVFEGYGHQDVFMGRNAARDVFGHLVEFLSRAR